MLSRWMCLCIFGGCLLTAAAFEIDELQKLIAPGETYNVFHSTPEKAPDDDVIQVMHCKEKREIPFRVNKVNIKAIDESVDKYLNPNEGSLFRSDTPVWIAAADGTLRKLKDDIMADVIKIYQSTQTPALVSTGESGELRYDSTAHEMSIVALPSQLQEKVKKRDVAEQGGSRETRSVLTTNYRVVYKAIKGVTETETTEKPHDAPPAAVGKVVYPSLLVTTDFNLPVNPANDSAYYEQIIYQMAFWNAVDLRFRNLTNPKVRLSIAGLIIGAGRESTPYVHANTVNGEVNLYPAMNSMETYWYRKQFMSSLRETRFHMIVTATNMHFFTIDKSGTKIIMGGLANTASFCGPNPASRYYQTALIHDDLGFGSVNTAVHELAHLFGAHHDNGTEGECGASDGYIMSPKQTSSVNNPTWSRCSEEELRSELRLVHCAYNLKPDLGTSLPRVLPGSLRTVEEQCTARGYDHACEATPEICRTLKCYFDGWSGFFRNFRRCENSYSAAEGTECAPGKICLDGQCRSRYKDIECI